MAQPLLSIKLSELDQTIEKLRSRIQCSEDLEKELLQEEIAQLKQEYLTSDQLLHKKLNCSRAEMVSILAKMYDEIKQSMQAASNNLQYHHLNFTSSHLSEEKLLLAEYALDFAVQAANHALLLSLEAILTQRTQDDIQERSIL